MSEKGKEAGIAVTAEELARINRFAKKELRAEEVYTFAVKLCDNEVDRDFERFDRAALEKLSELFVGRTGIFDHSWSAGVVKRFGQSEGSLKAMVRACGSRAQVRELEELEKLSALGKSYLGALRREVRRLMLVADETLDGAVAESVTEKLGERELLELKKAFGARAAKKLGTNVQIVDPREKREENERDFCV